MNWQDQLQQIIHEQLPTPTFEHWLDTSGYRLEADRIRLIPSPEMQARAMMTLYEYYQSHIRRGV